MKNISLTFLILFSLFSCQQISSDIDNVKGDGPGHPGWMEDWEMMKIEAGSERPANFNLLMHNMFKDNLSDRFAASNFIDVRELGPNNVGGRTRAFMVDLADSDHYYAGGVSGGLWESENAGATWFPNNKNSGNLSVISITQSPFDHNIIYYSTGELAGNSAGLDGVGIFKSTDGGDNFELIPASDVSSFFGSWRIVHSKTDANTVYIGTNDGLFVTRDGGIFFDRLVSGRCNDIEIREDGSMFATIASDGIYYSDNGADNSFSRLTSSSLPSSGSFGRIELAYCLAEPNIVYAAYGDSNNDNLLDIYVTQNDGTSWQDINSPADIGGNVGQIWYNNSMAVHPTNKVHLLFGAVNTYYSTNAGIVWERIDNVHSDNHRIVFMPDNEDEVILASDGGISKLTFANGEYSEGQSMNSNYNITQFYTGDIFPGRDHIIGGTQDNGTQESDPNSQSFIRVFGGDGAFCLVNPIDSQNVYISTQNGRCRRTFTYNGSRSWKDIMSQIDFHDDSHYFIGPLHMNEKKPNQLFYCSRDRLWASSDSGNNWSQFIFNGESPYWVDTREKLDGNTVLFVSGQSGFLARIDDVESHVLGDEIDLSATLPASIRNAYVRQLVLHPTEDVLYIALSSFAFGPRVWKASNIMSDNLQWEPISGNLPAFLPVNTIDIVEDKTDVLVIGTDYGLFTTDDEGENWVLETDIPLAPIFKVKINERHEVYAWTHGRGVFRADLRDFSATNNPKQSSIEFTVFPNPVQEELLVKTRLQDGIELLKVMNMSGQIVHQEKWSAINGEQIINVQAFVPGTYVIQLITNKNTFATEVFIKK